MDEERDEVDAAAAGGRPPEEGDPHQGSSRRTFLKLGVGLVGAGIGLTVAIPATRFLLFPLDHEVTSSGQELVLVGRRDQFSAEPVKVDVFADRVDAWNRVEEVKIGSAWIVEREGALVALSTRCPHLGCAIDWNSERGKFDCPCHDSSFDLDGRHEHGPSPRDMDTLELREDDERVLLRHRRFKQGVATKEPL